LPVKKANQRRHVKTGCIGTCRQYWCFLLSSMLTFLSGVIVVLLTRLLFFFLNSNKVSLSRDSSVRWFFLLKQTYLG
jgi:hypothetical protein